MTTPMSLFRMFGPGWADFELDDPLKMPDSAPYFPGVEVRRWETAQLCLFCESPVSLPDVHLAFHRDRDV